MGRPLAYFLTWTCYGTWLHGDERGSVDAEHNEYRTPVLEANAGREWEAQRRLASEPEVLSEAARDVVERTIRAHCVIRRWGLRAVNVRTNHVHVVVSADVEPEVALVQFKAWSTRRLREAGLSAANRDVWTEHGSTRYLWTPESVERACEYVLNGQGAQ